METDNIVNAIKKIRNICGKNKCADCPFFNDEYGCMFQMKPFEYTINEKTEEKLNKLFKGE